MYFPTKSSVICGLSLTITQTYETIKSRKFFSLKSGLSITLHSKIYTFRDSIVHGVSYKGRREEEKRKDCY